MTNEEPIRGVVAAILNRREVALNVGEIDGVTVGTRFAILNRQGLGIVDPTTGEPLGDVPVAKTVVKVTRVEGPHLSVARTFRTIPAKPGISALAMGASTWAGRPERPETLAIDPSREDLVELAESDSYVKKGDPAVETHGDEFDDYA